MNHPKDLQFSVVVWNNYWHLQETKPRRIMTTLDQHNVGVKRERPKGQRNAYRVQIQPLSRYWAFRATEKCKRHIRLIRRRRRFRLRIKQKRKRMKNPENQSCQKPGPSFLILFPPYLSQKKMDAKDNTFLSKTKIISIPPPIKYLAFTKIINHSKPLELSQLIHYEIGINLIELNWNHRHYSDPFKSELGSVWLQLNQGKIH